MSSGYDAAASNRAEDDLDRWRFAADIVEVVLTTPPEWSARIGIFGKWGEGKSTVMRFAEQMLREKETIVFWFNPWAIQDWNDLWNAFGDRLSVALSLAGIPVDSPWLKMAKTLESKKVSQLVKVGAAVAGREKAAEAAFGLVGQWLTYDGPQIRMIQEKAKGKRIVVLVDDLDRCAPELLPQLLLSLRELLDLPGFTFLLAFDDEIVSRALIDKNPAWSEGSGFLEKILDFRFHLPPVSEKQKERLVFRALSKYCPFVPKESVKGIQDLLPSSPRKLKALIRSLAALRPQIVRHGSDEFSWSDMWLAQMVRLESSAFFDRILTGDRLDRLVGSLYRLLRERPQRGLRGEDKEKDDELKALIKDCGVKSDATTARILKLVDAARARATLTFRYVCEMAIRPHAVTWKEFEDLFSRWQSDRKAAVLTTWIKAHASERHVSIDDVEFELFDSIIERRQRYLAAAAESTSVSEQESNANQASLLLQMAGQYLGDLQKMGAAEFKKIYGQAAYWIGFRTNPSDKSLRAQEEDLLMTLLRSSPSSLSTELFECVYPENNYPGLDDTTAPREALRSKCLQIVYSRAAEEAINFFGRDGAINSLFEGNRFFAVKCCLFKPDSPIWSNDLRGRLVDVIRSGRTNFVAYVNVRDFFRILIQGLETGIDWIRREDIAKTLANEAVVRSVWETIMARGIQFRFLTSFLRGRNVLMQNGVSEESLPLNDELRSRLADEKLRGEIAHSE